MEVLDISPNPGLRRLAGLQVMTGNTPLVAVHFKFRGTPRVIYCKAEYLSLTGSVKDRMAFHILKRAYEQDTIKPGDVIAEATSGNTGIAFAALGRAMGHPVRIYMPDWMSQERVRLIQSFGAEIIPVSREQGGFLGSIHMTEEFRKERNDIFLPCQFSNSANCEAHERTTGPEIQAQLASLNLRPDAFVAGVGTGGTVMGTGRYLKRSNPAIRIHPIEPAESPTLSTGEKVGSHRIQGISDEFIPEILNLDELDSVLSVPDGDAIIMAQRLAADLGLAVGISSGANFIGALMAQNELGAGATVVTLFCDDNKKYLSTDLLRTEPVKPGFLSTDIELLRYQAIRPDCAICSGRD